MAARRADVLAFAIGVPFLHNDRMKLSIAARRPWCCALLALAMGAVAADKKTAKVGVAQDHLQEELGVNAFTTPSIETLLTALHELRPVPYDKVSRVMPEGNPGDRARLALTTGGIIADGFLAVAAEKGSRMEPIGRALLQHAKGLGV